MVPVKTTFSEGTASVQILEYDGIWFASNLSGKPLDALALIRKLKEAAGKRPIRFTVAADEKMEHLVTLYMHLGATPVGIIMEYGGKQIADGVRS